MNRVVAATYNSRIEADIAVARLTHEGIDAMVVTDSAGGFEPQLDMIRGVRVMVWDEDLASASEVLQEESIAELEPPETAVGPGWLRTLAWWLAAIAIATAIITLLRMI